jgi:hypothetical protein
MNYWKALRPLLLYSSVLSKNGAFTSSAQDPEQVDMLVNPPPCFHKGEYGTNIREYQLCSNFCSYSYSTNTNTVSFFSTVIYVCQDVCAASERMKDARSASGDPSSIPPLRDSTSSFDISNDILSTHAGVIASIPEVQYSAHIPVTERANNNEELHPNPASLVVVTVPATAPFTHTQQRPRCSGVFRPANNGLVAYTPPDFDVPYVRDDHGTEEPSDLM